MARLLDVPTHSDTRGSLSAFDGIVPFPVRRVSCVHGVPPERSRAGHSHRTNRQVVACVAGRCEVQVLDGHRRQLFALDSPGKALLLESADWHRLARFGPDTTLLVLASEAYGPDDYVYEPYA